MFRTLSISLFLIIIIAFASCSKSSTLTSSTTGWPYDYKANNAFRGLGSSSDLVPPGMVEIPGWTITVDDAKTLKLQIEE